MIVNLANPQNNLFERTDTLKRYYEDIRKYEVLDNEYELELIQQYKNSSNVVEKNEIKDIIICANQRFALGVVRRWATNENIMDLISEANIGMIEALEDFDIEQKVRFITFAVHYIRRSINTYLMRNGCAIRKKNIAKTYHLTSQATNLFMQREQRQPTVEELNELIKKEYGVDIKDSNDILTLQISSIDDNIDNEDEDNNFGTMLAFNNISASRNEYEKTHNQEFIQVIVESVLKKLTPNEQEVIRYNFGIGHVREYELAEIAEKMNFSSERIRQMRISALEKIKKEYAKLLNKL